MDKEKLVRDLVNSFKDRDELHTTYKKRMKEIISSAFINFFNDCNNCEVSISEWVDNFVEERFKPSDN
ncbi:hypothetical protein LRR18_16295 [Mangrovimonas sp. AS39]|uniref:hypothetical protein n=1 Tax=Mangrovimonas futianensis TaxID=2895523 RepID=UPI001E30CD3E|nr:hypothetical protein [Mangrovimonas futianensis]MCF1193150.1 hypothetical protein [Mangrovimonas futianensis]